MGSEYQLNMGAVDGWNHTKHQCKILWTQNPMFRIFSGFGMIGTSIQVWRALKYFCPVERVVDKHATRAEKENKTRHRHTCSSVR
jgi:hypothetical protein